MFSTITANNYSKSKHTKNYLIRIVEEPNPIISVNTIFFV